MGADSVELDAEQSDFGVRLRLMYLKTILVVPKAGYHSSQTSPNLSPHCGRSCLQKEALTYKQGDVLDFVMKISNSVPIVGIRT